MECDGCSIQYNKMKLTIEVDKLQKMGDSTIIPALLILTISHYKNLYKKFNVI